MKNPHLLRRLLPNAYISDSHGEFFTLELSVGKLYVWAFESQYDLQAIIVDMEGKILHDFRDDACKEASDRWVEQFPSQGRTWVVTHRRDLQ